MPHPSRHKPHQAIVERHHRSKDQVYNRQLLDETIDHLSQTRIIHIHKIDHEQTCIVVNDNDSSCHKTNCDKKINVGKNKLQKHTCSLNWHGENGQCGGEHRAHDCVVCEFFGVAPVGRHKQRHHPIQDSFQNQNNL